MHIMLSALNSLLTQNAATFRHVAPRSRALCNGYRLLKPNASVLGSITADSTNFCRLELSAPFLAQSCDLAIPANEIGRSD